MIHILDRHRRFVTLPRMCDHLTVKTKFYAALTTGAHNPVLVEMLRLIHGRVSMLRATTLAQPGRLAASLTELGNIVKTIKDSKMKVGVSIQGDVVRVSGKDRDTLQDIIALLRQHDFGIDMQFTNYRTN